MKQKLNRNKDDVVMWSRYQQTIFRHMTTWPQSMCVLAKTDHQNTTNQLCHILTSQLIYNIDIGSLLIKLIISNC